MSACGPAHRVPAAPVMKLTGEIDEHHDQNVMPPLRKLARIEDKATGLFLEEIEFPVSQTEVRRIAAFAAVVNDPAKLEDDLLDHGAVLANDAQQRKAQLEEVAKSNASNHFVYEAQGGWLEPASPSFCPMVRSVQTTPTLSASAPRSQARDPSGRRAKRGTASSWRDTVGQMSCLSSVTMFAVSAAWPRHCSRLPGPNRSRSTCMAEHDPGKPSPHCRKLSYRHQPQWRISSTGTSPMLGSRSG